MLLKQPYFMENEEWYYYDKKKNKYFLTNKAPKKAIESYNEFYNKLNKPDMVFFNDILTKARQRLIDTLKQQNKTDEEIQKELSEWEERVYKQ